MGYWMELAMIDGVHIAYDVDKVVERLEVLSDSADDKIMKNEGLEQYYDGFGDGLDEALRIVKEAIKG